jgi:hypothetical protein
MPTTMVVDGTWAASSVRHVEKCDVVVPVNLWVAGDESEAFAARLCDEHAIERGAQVHGGLVVELSLHLVGEFAGVRQPPEHDGAAVVLWQWCRSLRRRCGGRIPFPGSGSGAQQCQVVLTWQRERESLDDPVRSSDARTRRASAPLMSRPRVGGPTPGPRTAAA